MRSPDPLSVSVEQLEDARLIRATGEVDLATVPMLRQEVEAARDDGATVLLDFSEVTFIDSTGLHFLLEASSSAAGTGWPFFIVRPSAAVRRLIEVSRTAELLALVEPAPDAVLG